MENIDEMNFDLLDYDLDDFFDSDYSTIDLQDIDWEEEPFDDEIEDVDSHENEEVETEEAMADRIRRFVRGNRNKNTNRKSQNNATRFSEWIKTKKLDVSHRILFKINFRGSPPPFVLAIFKVTACHFPMKYQLDYMCYSYFHHFFFAYMLIFFVYFSDEAIGEDRSKTVGYLPSRLFHVTGEGTRKAV